MPQRILKFNASTDRYSSADGLTVAREFDTETPNGNPMAGRWVLRDAAGTMVDFHQYRNDLAEHNDVRLVGAEV